MSSAKEQDPRQDRPRIDGRLRDREVAERFGENLSKARRRAGFSQEELGKLASLHRTHIGYIEIGQRLPRVDNLAKLTSALAVRADELLEGVDWIVTTPTRPGNFDVDPRG
jgi:ribosome-binding protein aMBF1 (putative translation factor)